MPDAFRYFYVIGPFVKKYPFQVLLITVIIIGVFYPGIFAQFNSIDDFKMINSLQNLDNFSIDNIFFPNSYGQYYRPLLYLTFIADKFIWGLEPGFMHLENILLHLGNALLVFWLTRQIISSFTNFQSYFYAPLVTALLFGLHPIATEPVNWVSGRTDLLSGFFMLTAFNLFLIAAKQDSSASSTFDLGGSISLGGRIRFKQGYWLRPSHIRNYVSGLLGALALLAGCLSKETALFALPVILAWCVFLPDRGTNFRVFITSFSLRIFLFAIHGAAGAIYFILRWLALSGGDRILNTAVKIAGSPSNAESVNIFDVVRIVTKTAGFYFKKLIIPVPLNFGINNISPHYFWLGLLVLCGVAWCIYKRDIISHLFLAAFILTSSAFALPVLKITWTPIAERYVYMALAPFLIGVTLLYIKYLSDKLSTRVSTLVVATVLGSAAIVTAERNIIWQDNFTLFEDTLRKSSDFGAIKNEYAIALRSRGRVAEADQIMLTNVVDEFQPSSLNIIRIMVNQGNLEEARMMLQERLKKPGDYDQLSYELLLKVDEMRREKATKDSEKKSIDREILADIQKLNSMSGDPFYHYRIGVVQLRLGEQKEAKLSFTKAWQGSSPNSHYHNAAKKLAEKL